MIEFFIVLIVVLSGLVAAVLGLLYIAVYSGRFGNDDDPTRRYEQEQSKHARRAFESVTFSAVERDSWLENYKQYYEGEHD